MNRRWICNDFWMDIFPCFDHAQLGLKLALLSPRFNALVDKHFDGKSELTIWRQIAIHRKDSFRTASAAPEFLLFMDDSNSVPFPLPDRPLPSKIRFKRLQTPRKDGQPKRLRCEDYNKEADFNWVNKFKKAFLRANAISSVSYEIHFTVHVPSFQIVPFELVNEWTKEKLTMAKAKKTDNWIMKRCKIIGENGAVQQQKKDENWDNNCNTVSFWLFSGTHGIGPLSPHPSAEENKAGQSIIKGSSSAADI